MESTHVPVLKYGGRVRVLKEKDPDPDDEELTSVKKNETENMLENGSSQLIMPTHSQGYINQYRRFQDMPQSRSEDHSRSKRESEYERQIWNDKETQRQSYRENQYRNRSERGFRESNIKDYYILAGSEYIEDDKLEPKTKTNLTTEETSLAMNDLKDALESDMFRVWPLYEGEEVPGPGGGKAGAGAGKGKYTGKGKGKEKVKWQPKDKTIMEESAIMPVMHTTSEKERRDAIAEQWEAKEERDITGRRRVTGGYEDVLEDDLLKSLDWFQKPTLMGVKVQEYQRGQDTDEENEGEEWDRVRRREREERGSTGGKRMGQRWSAKDSVRKYGSAKTDTKTKNETRSASEERKDSTTKPISQAEEEYQRQRTQASNDKPTLARRSSSSQKYFTTRSKSSAEQEKSISTKSKSQVEQEQNEEEESDDEPAFARRPTYTSSFAKRDPKARRRSSDSKS